MDGLMRIDERATDGGARGPDPIVRRIAPAKINWNLRVLGRRADGFHEIESLVSTVSVSDELSFAPRSDTKITLQCSDPDLPGDASNLVLRAARLLAERSGQARGVSCRLSKYVPVGGGLGGGSSDAAMTLAALNELWGLNWPRPRLLDLAAELGSDVSFFLVGGSAVIRGRGELVQPVELPWRGWVVLMLPGWGISTAEVYQAWRAESCPVEAGPAVPAGVSDAVEWMRQTFNMLEMAAMKVCPALRELMDRAERTANRPVRLSGSGSTFFTAFDEREEAESFARRVGGLLDVTTRVVQPVAGDGTEVRPVGHEENDSPPRMYERGRGSMVYLGGDPNGNQ